MEDGQNAELRDEYGEESRSAVSTSSGGSVRTSTQHLSRCRVSARRLKEARHQIADEVVCCQVLSGLRKLHNLNVRPAKLVPRATRKHYGVIHRARAGELNETQSCVFECYSRLLLRIAVEDSSSSYRLSLKFGAGPDTAGQLLERAAELGLEVVGVSFHVGSKCSQSSAFRQAIADARRVFDTAVSAECFFHCFSR